MRFNREKFIDETCGSLDAAMDVIDNLVNVITFYINNDECAGGNGYGCFTNPEKAVDNALRDNHIAEYFKKKKLL